MKLLEGVIERLTVQAVVTFGLAAGFLYGFIAGMIPVDAYVTATGLVLGYWFRDRQDAARKDRDPN